MPSHDYWETACKNAEFKYWEPEYPSPELSAPAASWFFRKNARVLDAGTGGGNDAVFPALCGLKVTAIDLEPRRPSDSRTESAQSRGESGVSSRQCTRPSLSESFFRLCHRPGVVPPARRLRVPIYASELFRVLKPAGKALIRGAGGEAAKGRFNPVTEDAIDRFFPTQKFERGPIVPSPLYSGAGAMEGRIVVLQKQRAQV